MKRRVSTFALVFAICAALLCLGASAAAPQSNYSIWVCGALVTDGNASDILDDGGSVSYDVESNTLILNGAELKDTSYYAVIISQLDSINILLVGDNVIAASETTSYSDSNVAALYSSGEITISGSGTLAADSKGSGYPVIYSASALKIGGDASVKVTANEGSMGIFAQGSTSDVELSGNADVTVITSSNTGIYAEGNVIISENANVSVDVDGSGTALAADEAINISGGSVYATSATGNAMYAVTGGIHISDGYTEAVSESARPAVNAPGIVEITGGELRAEAWGNIAIQATNEHDPFGEFVVTNAKVTAISHPVGSTNPPPAIYAPADIRITNSEVYAESEGYGMYSNTTIDLTGSAVDVISATDWAMASRGLNIDNSAVRARSPEGNDAIYILGAMGVDDSWIDCIGTITVTDAYELTDSVVIINGSGQAAGDAVVPDGTILDETKVLTVPSGTTLTVPVGTTFTNNGTIVVESRAQLVNRGTINNNDEIIISTNAALGNYGEIANEGEIDLGGQLEGEGEITGSGIVRRPTGNLPTSHDIELTVSGGGEALLSLNNASAGATITVTATPDEGFELGYITVDGERIDGTTFTMPDHDVTVRVYFAAIGAALPFTDVAEGDWFYSYVEYVYDNGLMDGVSATEFEPNGNMSRAMVWAILARIDGETVAGENWAETAREWAMANGVSDGEDADGYVTREQLATMLWRYAGEPGSDYSLSAYTDAVGVSGYASEAMAWAVERGIITGVADATLEPQGTATRAQCAAILMRFVELGE